MRLRPRWTQDKDNSHVQDSSSVLATFSCLSTIMASRTSRSWLRLASNRRIAVISRHSSSNGSFRFLSPGLTPSNSKKSSLFRSYYSSQASSDQQRQQEQFERRRKEKQKEHERSKKQQEDDALPAGVTPWARFMDVLKSEYAKSQEMQENVRELTGTAQGLKDSEAAQKMRQAYTAMRLQTLIKENPKLAAMATTLSKTGRSVSDAVNSAAKEIEDSRLVQAAKRVTAELDKRIGEPIRQTEAYKVVEATVDFSQGALRYGGYIEKEERRRKRQKRLERLGKTNTGFGVPGGPGSQVNPINSTGQTPSDLDRQSSSDSCSKQNSDLVPENPNAQPALVLHATANQDNQDDNPKSVKSRFASITPEPIRRAWENFQNTYEDSDNPVVASMRTVTGAIRKFFDETETAKVVRMIKEMDPEFEFDGFLRDLREYIVPEIVDAYVDCDLKSLKLWTSEGAYNVITAPIQTYIQRGLLAENQVIDLRGTDIMSAKVLQEQEIPVFVVAFKTHEINCLVNSRTGIVEVGDREEIQQVQYVIVMTREADKCGNEVTGGWKIIDMARRSTVAFL
ncbi:hypothetical protein O181_029547 [Austropuccinia psidii MF-1]|uniref:Mitochondrial import inner membrane translocase subunit TIM44 n=1 Tax=Austropuccinia psidii MF-1 TaxID=1389203 RepID=A0A9Q3CU02_9BASI|nr:hypothetical protein [Austropuccinia psidii MF-1]